MITMYTTVQQRTYFSDVFPKTTIHLALDGRGVYIGDGRKILKENGDYNKNFTVVVDDEFELLYTNYIENNSSKSK